MFMIPFPRAIVPVFVLLAGLGAGSRAAAQAAPPGDATRGRTYFQQNCALCHAVTAGTVQQGPSLLGVVGRRAASSPGYTYSKALLASGLTWDPPTLDHFLAGPTTAVPGTAMPIAVSKAEDRLDVIAYLATLKAADTAPAVTPTPTASSASNAGDWQNAAPGVQHHITVADLPPPYATRSSGNGPHVVKQPDGAALSVPPGFTVKLFASGLSDPRLVRVAPNGDIFIVETGANRIRVLRAADGAESPSQNQIFADGLDRPFGIAFYPAGDHPQWIYVGNNNSVVRIPYQSGDLQASGPPETIVPQLTQSHGGHSTRDVAFSLDGKRLFISVGSGSNVGESMSKKDGGEAAAWDTEHGLGAGWDAETNRATILVTDPEGKLPLRTFANGIRNGVGIAVNPETGDLWTSTNERDGLGDDLVPDYITRVKEGAFYGWPWFYLGNHEDPRHAGERPDLASQVTVPDVLLQAHSASLEMTFYPASETGVAAFPAEYGGDIFAAEHGSWNRSTRTAYKVIRVRLNHGVPTGEYDDFLTGFVVDNRNVWGRPVGVAVAHDGALLVTEDGNNTVWRVAPSGH